MPGALPDDARRVLERFGPIADRVEDSEEALKGVLGEAVALVARGPTRVTASVLEAAPRLRVVGRTGVGTDNVDLEAASSRGVAVVVTPGANEAAVAEGAVALLLGLVKRLPALGELVRSGRFGERDAFQPGDFAGSVLAVVGFGRIGRRTAELGRVLGAEVLAVDPLLDSHPDVEVVDLDDALARADHITLHVPLTEGTKGLITAARLRSAGCQGLNLVNLARGAVAPLDELEAALEEGTLGGVALDVYDPEPPDTSHPLLKRPEVLLTPHSLALTPGALHAMFTAMAEGVAAVLEGRPEDAALASF